MAKSKPNSKVGAERARLFKQMFASPIKGLTPAKLVSWLDAYFDRYMEIEGPIAQNGTNYVYLFAANFWNAYRNYDPDAPAPPAAPSSLAAGQTGFNTVPLTWTDNASTESSYEVQMSTTAGSGFTTVATLPANSTSTTVTGIPQAAVRYFRVRAVNGAGGSDYSSEVSATTADLGRPKPNRRPGVSRSSGPGF